MPTPYEHFSGYLVFVPAILLLGAGMLALIPFYLLWHIWRYLLAANGAGRMLVVAGCVIPCMALCVYLALFRHNFNHYRHVWQQERSINRVVRRLPRNYFTERFLGVGIKYHTKIEYVYDGWRPPLNDPFLNIGLWIFSRKDSQEYGWAYDTPPYGVHGLEQKAACYKLLFPGRSVKANCYCSWSYSGRSYMEYLLH